MIEVGYVPVIWLRAVKVWWSLLWRSVLFCFLASAFTGFFLGFFLGLVKVEPEKIKSVCIIAGYIVSIPIGVAVVKSVLTKHFSDFKIALIVKEQASEQV